MNAKNQLLLTGVLVAFLTGCGGGSSDGSAGGSTADTNTPSTNTPDNNNNSGNNTTDSNNPVAGDASGDFAMVAQSARSSALVNLPTAVSGANSYTVYYSENDIAVSSPATGSTQQSCSSLPCTVTGLENGKVLKFRIEALNGSSRVGISHQILATAGAINDTGEASCISITTGSFPNGISNCDDLPAGADMWPKDVLSGAVALPTGRVPQQDGNTGRDANAQLVKVGSGIAGFDYTKLDANGNSVSASNTAFECVRDNLTGLVWQTNRPTNPAEDWQGVPRDYEAAASGSENYSRCGLTSGWRLPTKAEAESLLQYSRTGISADTDFFTDLENGWYWTSSPYPAALSGPDAATGVQNDSIGSNFHNWVINFTTGQRSTFDTSGSGSSSESLTMYVNDTANQ